MNQEDVKFHSNLTWVERIFGKRGAERERGEERDEKIEREEEGERGEVKGSERHGKSRQKLYDVILGCFQK